MNLVFDAAPPSDAFPGARRDGRTLSLLASRNVDEIVARARAMNALSVDVQPVMLKEIFLESSKGGPS